MKKETVGFLYSKISILQQHGCDDIYTFRVQKRKLALLYRKETHQKQSTYVEQSWSPQIQIDNSTSVMIIDVDSVLNS